MVNGVGALVPVLAPGHTDIVALVRSAAWGEITIPWLQAIPLRTERETGNQPVSNAVSSSISGRVPPSPQKTLLAKRFIC